MYVLKYNVFITLVFGFKLEKSLHRKLKPKDPDWPAILNPQVLLKLSVQDGPMETYSRDTETGTDTKKDNTAGQAQPSLFGPKGLATFPKQSAQALFARDGPIETYLRTPWHTHTNIHTKTEPQPST